MNIRYFKTSFSEFEGTQKTTICRRKSRHPGNFIHYTNNIYMNVVISRENQYHKETNVIRSRYNFKTMMNFE